MNNRKKTHFLQLLQLLTFVPSLCLSSDVLIQFGKFGSLVGQILRMPSIHQEINASGKECMLLCMTTNGCQSANYFHHNKSCEILKKNRHINESNLTFFNEGEHYFRESQCDNKPCQNDGLCIPNYDNNTYQCKCTQQRLHVTKGKHCEKILTKFHSATLYIDFEQVNKTHITGVSDVLSKVISVRYDQALGKIMNAPERSTGLYINQTDELPVATFPLKDLSKCFINFADCQGKGMTMMVWFKLDMKTTGLQAALCTGEWNDEGMLIGYDQTYSNLVCSVTLSKGKRMSHTLKESDEKWNHIVCIYESLPYEKVVIYVNGIKSFQRMRTKDISANDNYGDLTIGFCTGAKFKGRGMIDDAAIWDFALTSEEVQALYKETEGNHS